MRDGWRVKGSECRREGGREGGGVTERKGWRVEGRG